MQKTQNLGKTWNFLRLLHVKFVMAQKIYCIEKKSVIIHIFLVKTFKEALRYLFNVAILFNTVFYHKLNFKLKVDLKTCSFKDLENFLKTWRKFSKKTWQP